jgi:formate hydrogenlyase subunit 3/multisubunit Na+/H+ antiporter MnhD subunit
VTFVGTSLGTAAVAAMLAMAAACILPRRARALWVGVLSTASAAAGGAASVAVLAGSARFSASYPDLLPLGGIRIEFDALSGIFTLAAAVVAVPASIYGIGYALRGPSSRPVQAAYPLLVWTMMMVPAAGNVSGLVVLWELMAVSSLVLVLAEHHHNPEARTAAQWYAAVTHLSLLAIVVALLILAHAAGGDSFESMRDGAGQVSAGVASVVFLLALVGFGAKAGVVPVHVWLPRAHPEAPSHVSALMSGAMVKLGIYGVVRVGWDLLGGGPSWWGAVVLLVGLVSAMFGILHALLASDLKRLLAYSTTENVGLIFIGIGAAGLFASTGNRPLAAVALAAAFLHVINHAAFKGLLFLGAGSIHSATGTRDLDSLGGLSKRMPVTAATFAIGALAIAALPPLNGFVSEWLLLQSLVHSLPSKAVAVAVAMPVAVAIVALVGGLAAATFVKAFGTAFLAMPRTIEAEQARESPRTMQAGLVALAAACVALALAPTVLADPLRRATEMVRGLASVRPIHTNGVYLQLSGIQAGLSPLLLATGLAVMMVATLAVVRRSRVRHTVRNIAAWGCGRTVQTSRMEYTATSFAEPLQRVFDDVLHPEIDVDVDHRTESRHYVQAIRYRVQQRDTFEQRVYLPLLALVRRWGDTARRVQNGSIHRYLTFSLITLIVVLVASR